MTENITQDISILYEDEFLIFVNKPNNMAIHRSQGMPHDEPVLLSCLGKQIETELFNVHRLDAKTSGVVLLAKERKIANQLTSAFERHEVEKKYIALVRGKLPETGIFDTTVQKQAKGRQVQAETRYKRLELFTSNISYKTFENIELSLAEIEPITGRWHQIRQHFCYNRFDIIGDNNHGDRTLNHIIEERINHKQLYLHAQTLEIKHPINEHIIKITTPIPEIFNETIKILNC
ncbi:MAG: pseudouridine synthase [Salinivirgaceae bacterium]|nr:pseudouridine synthase [Salinivirgaceae bacterium]